VRTEDEIRSLRVAARTFGKEGGNLEQDLKIFFWFALGFRQPYPYDVDKTDETYGHILYRISDFVPEQLRRKIQVYESDKGSLIEKNLISTRWASLEDWRKVWKDKHPIIPDYAETMSKFGEPLPLSNYKTN
jgi:hypothetical protein